MHLVQQNVEPEPEQKPCAECGFYNCGPCEDCGNIRHVGHDFPWCPHGYSTMRSGFTEVYDVQTGQMVTSARGYDKFLKANNLVIDDGGYKAKEAASFRVEQQAKAEAAVDETFAETCREHQIPADLIPTPGEPTAPDLYVEPNADFGVAPPEP